MHPPFPIMTEIIAMMLMLTMLAMVAMIHITAMITFLPKIA